ncbi:MAG: hypothetical protein LBU80_05640 [Rikenellaceae bacterium]|jgi:hypothetical protein|nr:hypothetical protein [Rikenellaceae bacterium]
MKKLLFATLLSVFSFGITSAQMPTAEVVQASVERYHKLQALLQQKPANVGMSATDNLVSKSVQAANNAVEISMLIERVAGTSPEANAEAPLTLDEYTVLSKRVDQENKDIQDLTGMSAAAANDLKAAKPLDKAKVLKSINYSKNIMTILTGEAAYHTQTMAGILASIKK